MVVMGNGRQVSNQLCIAAWAANCCATCSGHTWWVIQEVNDALVVSRRDRSAGDTTTAYTKSF